MTYSWRKNVQERLSLAIVCALCVIPLRAHAESFADARYDPNTDGLVVTVLYSGTNPDHEFSLAWDPCVNHPDGSVDVTAQLIDSQERDQAREEYRKTVHLSLSGLECRPARLTLRASPNAYIAVQIPANK